MPTTKAAKKAVPERFRALTEEMGLPPICTADQIADALGLNHRTVLRVPAWKLPRMKTAGGGRVRYMRDDVARYLAICAGEDVL